MKGRTQTEGIHKQSAEEGIWASEEESNKSRKTVQLEALCFVFMVTYHYVEQIKGRKWVAGMWGEERCKEKTIGEKMGGRYVGRGEM